MTNDPAVPDDVLQEASEHHAGEHALDVDAERPVDDEVGGSLPDHLDVDREVSEADALDQWREVVLDDEP